MSYKRKPTKDEWKLIVADELSLYNDKYDTLDILAVNSSAKDGKPLWRVNYKTTRGDWSTGFGTLTYYWDDVDNLLRDSKIKNILDG